jgi:hypothetical protein
MIFFSLVPGLKDGITFGQLFPPMAIAALVCLKRIKQETCRKNKLEKHTENKG